MGEDITASPTNTTIAEGNTVISRNITEFLRNHHEGRQHTFQRR